MERRPALALAAAGALIGAASVSMAAAGLLRAPEPSANASSPTSSETVAAGSETTLGPLDPVILVEQRDVYDTFVVQTATPTAADGSVSAPESGPTSSNTGASKTTTTTTTTTPSSGSPTTTVPSTSTTRPPGVPSSWPADKPIPPMPPGCQKPQLEDNGVWNCDH